MLSCRAVLVFVTLLGAVTCGKLPSDFKTCKRADLEHIKGCLGEAIIDSFHKLKNGIPDLGVPALEPLNVPSVTIDEGKGPVNVKQKYKNVNLHNIINSNIDKIDAFQATTAGPFELRLHISSPEYRMEADYDFNGRILLLPIVGKGKCVIKLMNVKTEIIIKGKIEKTKGVDYIVMDEFRVILTPEKVNYSFENLFNGDERLGKEMNTILNDNWKEVYQDVEAGYEEFIGSIGKHVANSIFSKVPFDELFPPQS